MRIRLRIRLRNRMRDRSRSRRRQALGLALLTVPALACGGADEKTVAAEEPCTTADAALGLCRMAGDPGPALIPPDWAMRICEDWQRKDGSCEMRAAARNFEECRRTEGLPAFEELQKRGHGFRSSLRSMERRTQTCLEKRGWQMTEAAYQRWLGRRPTPKSPS
jgi:hypothetical protein